MNSYPIASELSFFVLKRRQEQGDFGVDLRDTPGRLRTITGYNPRVFIADVPEVIGDSPNPNPVGIALGGDGEEE